MLCEPRVQQLNESHYAVVWLCPDGTDPPADPDQLTELCNFVLEVPDIVSCKPPNADVIEQPTAPTLPESTLVPTTVVETWYLLLSCLLSHYSVVITFIQVDTVGNEPRDAGDVLDDLDDSDALGDVADQLDITVEGEAQLQQACELCIDRQHIDWCGRNTQSCI